MADAHRRHRTRPSLPCCPSPPPALLLLLLLPLPCAVRSPSLFSPPPSLPTPNIVPSILTSKRAYGIVLLPVCVCCSPSLCLHLSSLGFPCPAGSWLAAHPAIYVVGLPAAVSLGPPRPRRYAHEQFNHQAQQRTQRNAEWHPRASTTTTTTALPPRPALTRR